MSKTEYTSAVPVICTSDVSSTIKYLVETLGFTKDWAWGEPPAYGAVKAGPAEIYITYDPDVANAIAEHGLAPDVFLWVKDIESVYASHRANHAEIFEELSLRPWGVQQYVVREPNGYHLKIAENCGPEIENLQR